MLCLTKALGSAKDFQEIAHATTAFIAIATPHSTSTDPKDWNQPQLIVGARGYRRRGYATSSRDAKVLADLSRQFELVAINLHILTVCEEKETAIKSLFLRGSSSFVSSHRSKNP